MGVSLHAIVLLKSTVARAPRQANVVRRAMASSTTHEERTAAQSRGPRVHAVTLDRIEQVNHNIRLLQLRPQSHTGEKSLQARPSGQIGLLLITSNVYSIVPPRSMVRRTLPRYSSSGRFYHHLNPAGS